MLSKEEFQSAKRLLLKMDEPAPKEWGVPEHETKDEQQERVLHPSIDVDSRVGLPCEGGGKVNEFNIRPRPVKAVEQVKVEGGGLKHFTPQPAPSVHWGKRPTQSSSPSINGSPLPSLPQRQLQPVQPTQSYVSDFLSKF
eukprot:TRINITY_DN27736_c0_g1_i1.p1 TRINITY_DN27736_c0_g1~~TRINITY_DN27736_c0_g1_i1.p1  ORF type:complete len:140 (+),score=38.91 TRINITY_DN27736_c0_g1_i1:96-515(+)